jgi:hypothetical protein
MSFQGYNSNHNDINKTGFFVLTKLMKGDMNRFTGTSSRPRSAEEIVWAMYSLFLFFFFFF